MRNGWERWGCSTWRRLRGSLMKSINNWRGSTTRTKPGSSQWYLWQTPDSGHKMKHRWFLWNIRKHFYCKGTEHWHRLPRGVMESLSLEVLKRPYGHDPGKPAVGHSGSAWAGGRTRWSPEVPSHLSHAVIVRLFLPWFLLLQKSFFKWQNSSWLSLFSNIKQGEKVLVI